MTIFHLKHLEQVIFIYNLLEHIILDIFITL